MSLEKTLRRWAEYNTLTAEAHLRGDVIRESFYTAAAQTYLNKLLLRDMGDPTSPEPLDPEHRFCKGADRPNDDGSLRYPYKPSLDHPDFR